MILDLAQVDFGSAESQRPIKDIGYWVDAFLTLSAASTDLKPGLFEVISSIQPESGLFVRIDDEQQVCAVRCVHDNELVGIFNLVTGANFKRRGHAKAMVETALKWAYDSGARFAWLQVEADNEAAVRLYSDFGFEELYRYTYRRAPVSSDSSGREIV